MSGNIENQEKTAEEAELEMDAANQASAADSQADEGSAAEEQKEAEDSLAPEPSEEGAGQEEDSAQEEDAAQDAEAKEKKSFFKKKEKKDKKDEKIDELNDRLIRTMAEFDNFRKRTEKEKTQMFEVGAKSIVEKILPVVDNFERGFSSVPEEEKGNSFVQGMELIYKQFIKCLEDAGVTPIEAVGKEFNPDFHNAVMHAEDENFGENIVSEEFQKGYMYHDSVVRHSMVKVVN